MENQHHMIKGYRELTKGEIALINEIKGKAEEVEKLVNKLSLLRFPDTDTSPSKLIDLRWLSIGKTHLQQGFMALTRAIAKPESF